MYSKYWLFLFCAFFVTSILWITPSTAHHKPGHDKGPKAEKHSPHGGKYKKRAGPPPWAPAHGYRAKHTYKSEKDGRRHEFIPGDLIKVPRIGLGTCDRATLGAILGAATGAAVGSQFGKGDGKVLTTVGGAIIGALVGGKIGRVMDQADQNCVGQILERAPTGASVAWKDPDRAANYSVTPTRTYRRGDGRYCREYETHIIIEGRTQNAHGTACRNADGSWEKVA